MSPLPPNRRRSPSPRGGRDDDRRPGWNCSGGVDPARDAGPGDLPTDIPYIDVTSCDAWFEDWDDTVPDHVEDFYDAWDDRCDDVHDDDRDDDRDDDHDD